MITTTTCRIAAAAFFAVLGAGAAQAVCSDAWADVTITCPNPVPYTGYRILTPTSRNLPTVGTPGYYPQYGQGGVNVYLHSNGTGYQDFNWSNPANYGRPY